jgi:hypothetical protein
MKKILMIAAILILTALSTHAQTWHTANQVTVAWDAVAPTASGDTIRYQVYSRTDTVSAGQAVGGEVTATQLLISFAQEGRYYLGVETIRYPQGETVGIRSANKAWSNVATDCGPDGPFGVVYYVAPGAPGGIRRVP